MKGLSCPLWSFVVLLTFWHSPAASGYELFGLGDFHGDESFFIKSMLSTGKFILDEDADIQWREDAEDEDFEIVITGDYVDRGEKGLTIIKTLMRLHEDWEDKLIPMVGNHEEFILMLSPDRNDGARDEYDDWPMRERAAGVLGVGDSAEAVEWLRERPVVFVSRSKILFAHGGVSPNIATKALQIAARKSSSSSTSERQKKAIGVINRVAKTHYELLGKCIEQYVIEQAKDDEDDDVEELVEKLEEKNEELEECDDDDEDDISEEIESIEHRLRRAAADWALKESDGSLTRLFQRAKKTNDCPKKPWPLATDTSAPGKYQSHDNGVTWWRGLGNLPSRLKEKKNEKLKFRSLEKEHTRTCNDVHTVNNKLGLKGQAVGHTTWRFMVDLCPGKNSPGPTVSLDVSPKECQRKGKKNDDPESCGFAEDSFNDYLTNNKRTKMQDKKYAPQSFHLEEGGTPERCLLQPFQESKVDEIEEGTRVDDDWEIDTNKPVAIECHPLVDVRKLVETL
uniref:Calcineurin-like phosphoesterase domain-containing protein n=1 Tax=Chromera velia CCMP2878 TaxID=1169474 RepID=A0A0G4IAW4_9ALVE|eukprot:Cvel_12572.t1-p1 / transcript=Cvel_12572.t1 / gene=Cvel_12572 / organism=Chromera_velia_CCMP2878 / gene_product=hypothetical protein / transcript_product=hypothetical protein / location=Cvel_scaffold827:61371-63995(+) / protein_length=509 / sequence_SO=supercontig / SO=protein_coding / is_pseudo=false